MSLILVATQRTDEGHWHIYRGLINFGAEFQQTDFAAGVRTPQLTTEETSKTIAALFRLLHRE